jgi:hypothetical protein
VKLAIQLANPKCRQYGQVQSSIGGMPGVGPMVSGPVNILSTDGGVRASMQALVPDRGGLFITAPREAQATERARVFYDWTHAGTEWSAIRTLGNASVWTFRSAGDYCAFINNYGRPEGNGYAWGVRGVLCRPGAAYSDEDLKKAMTLVLPK